MADSQLEIGFERSACVGEVSCQVTNPILSIAISNSLIEEGYHSTNPYHNSIHATDVTQAMHCFLQVKKIREYLTPLEIMASIIAAVTHDLDHPGVNQPFLIATSNHLAALYENSSVLENHHWRSAIGCLLESHVAEDIEDCRPELQRQISSLILATDITRQQEFLIRFKRYLDQDLLDMKLEEHRHFILQIALKCADISNPCRPWDVSKKWSQKVCEEFFRQGDYERQLNLPVTALCDRQSTSVPKIQAGFFTFVVYPLFEEWHRFLGDELSDDMMKNLNGNKIKWDELIKQESEEVKQDEDTSLTDPGSRNSIETSPIMEEVNVVEPVQKNNFLTVPEWNCQQRIGRRHSVPLSMQAAAPEVSRTILRRESLPVAEKRSQAVYQSGLLEEEEEDDSTNLPLSSTSFISSASDEERVLSSENLLPEPSITSITTVTEANRLSTVLGRRQSPQRMPVKCQLTRQQTFPPLQPYVRQRYMSTTVELSRCPNMESNSSSKSDISTKWGVNGDGSTESCGDTHCGTKNGCRTPPVLVLRESNRSSINYNDQEKQGTGKRETESSSHERGIKVAKLWDDKLLFGCYEKENLDPRKICNELNIEGPLLQGNGPRRNSPQGQLTRRRGSAPVGTEAINPMALALRGWNERFPRRGSVPADAIRYQTDEGYGLRVAQEFNIYTSQQHCPYNRHSSIPTETSWPEAMNKSRNRNKKILRRRSSGGPEMFCFSKGENESVLWKVEMLSKRHVAEPNQANPEGAGTRRRGSLPLDVLLATHSGDFCSWV
ncbi:hypothetical protein RUM43_003335 [Polyplax serrata]|uniref:Phosphodiesterase n=1 Tax=Polyplax serrata TaxID=468196 RepID=A0AAN8PED7_POLSC